MQNLQNFQTANQKTVDLSVPLQPVAVPVQVAQEIQPVLREATDRDLIDLMYEKQKTLISEQRAGFRDIQDMHHSNASPVMPIFWILIGVFLYFIISKLNENKRNFLDFVDRMWSEIHFLRKDGEILSKEVQEILNNFEKKTHLFDEKYGIIMRNIEEMQQVIDKPRKSHKKKVQEKITLDNEPILLPGLEVTVQDNKKDGFGF